MRILLWGICTSILVVLINGPAYWWIPFGYILLLYILDTIDAIVKDSID